MHPSILFWYDMVSVGDWWYVPCTLTLLVQWSLQLLVQLLDMMDMWYREASPLRILWYVVMDYVCMYETYSSGSGRHAFVDTCSWFSYDLFMLDISMMLRFVWLMIFVQLFVDLLCIWQMIFLSAEAYDVLFLILIYVSFIRLVCYISVHWAF